LSNKDPYPRGEEELIATIPVAILLGLAAYVIGGWPFVVVTALVFVCLLLYLAF
jgi:hypothetical protein